MSFFKGSLSNKIPDDSNPIVWDDFSLMLSKPENGFKDGSYFIRVKCIGALNNKNIGTLSPILIIDVDHGINDHSYSTPEYVSEILHDIGYQFILHTNFSHTPKRLKYRIIFLLDRMINNSKLKTLYQGVIDILLQNGIRIKKKSESTTWDQPWYLPRYKTKIQKKYFSHCNGGFKKIPVDKIFFRYKEQRNIYRTELTQ